MPDLDPNAEVYCFDIDGTICEEKRGDCANAQPIKSRISIVNQLYDRGATIYLMTARGMLGAENNQQVADEHKKHGIR